MRTILCVLLAFCSTRAVCGQDVPVPVETQHALLLRVLAYERALPERLGDELVIGVVYQSRYRISRRIGEAFQAAGAAGPPQVLGRPVRYAAYAEDDLRGLEAFVAREGVHVLFVAPLRAVAPDAVPKASRASGILSVGAAPADVAAGLTVGFDVQAGRPRILINQPAAAAEGARFSGQLLKLAHLIGAS